MHTDQHQQQELLLFRAFAEHADAMVAAKDLEGRYIYVNPAYCRLLGRTEQDCLGHTDDDLLPQEWARRSQASDTLVINRRETLHLEEAVQVDGVQRHYLTARFPIHDAHGELCATGQVATDITDNKQLEDELRERAERDPLTGCYNRAKLLEVATAENSRANRYRYPVTALMLDIDHFKAVNDRHGHAAGDRVISGIAQLCGASLRANDTLGRLGGDEFAILLPHTDLHEGMELARRIRQAVRQWSTTDDRGQPVRATVSIGVAQKHDVRSSFEQLLAEADAALYRAKADGRNCIRPHLRRWRAPDLRALFNIGAR